MAQAIGCRRENPACAQAVDEPVRVDVRTWLTAAGLVPGAVIPTQIHCGLLPAVKVTD